MKKILSVLLALLMMATFTGAVFAEFVPSINEKPAPDITDDGLDCDHEDSIIIVPVGDDNVSDELKDAYDDLNENGTDDFDSDLDDPVVRDLFEVIPGCDDAHQAGELEITIDLGVGAGEDVEVYALVDGEWKLLPAENNGDGTVTIKVDGRRIVAVLGNNRRRPATGDPATDTALWMGAMALSFVMIPVLCAAYAKENKKAEATEE